MRRGVCLKVVANDWTSAAAAILCKYTTFLAGSAKKKKKMGVGFHGEHSESVMTQNERRPPLKYTH